MFPALFEVDRIDGEHASVVSNAFSISYIGDSTPGLVRNKLVHRLRYEGEKHYEINGRKLSTVDLPEPPQPDVSSRLLRRMLRS